MSAEKMQIVEKLGHGSFGSAFLIKDTVSNKFY